MENQPTEESNISIIDRQARVCPAEMEPKKPIAWRHHLITYKDADEAKWDIEDQFRDIENLARIADGKLVADGNSSIRPKPEFDWYCACFIAEQIKEKAGIILNALSYIQDEEDSPSVSN